MYIKKIDTTLESVSIYYPTLYITNQSKNSVDIRKITLTGIQSLEKNNKINLYTEPKITINLVKDN